MFKELLQIFGPDVTLILLVAGIWLAVTAVYIPGTGVPESAAFFSLALGVAGLFSMEINPAGLALLFSALACFLLLLFLPDMWWLIIMGLALQVLGSIFTYPAGSRPQWWTVLLMNAAALAYHQLIIYPGLRVQHAAPHIGIGTMVGMEGVVTKRIAPTGIVRLQSERWKAAAEMELEEGQHVLVVEQDGLHLTVRPVERGAPITRSD